MVNNIYELTRNNYEDHAEMLYRLWKDSNQRNSAKIETFISMLPPGGRILDLGAGFGKDMTYLYHRGFECVGVDTCKAFLEIARKACPQCRILEVDFRDMTFNGNEFDGVWARGTLFHLTKVDFELVLGKIRHFLRPRGIFYLQLLEGRFEGVTSIGPTDALAYYSFYERPELERLMSRHAFRLVHEIGTEGWLNQYYQAVKAQ
jgi:SAM-dependent methyltransferase